MIKSIFMKKKLLFILFASTSLSAQIREKGDVEIIPFIGYSTSDYIFSDSGNLTTTSASSITFGADFDYFFNDRWSFHSGLSYQRKGVESEGFFSSVGEQKLNYLTIPLNVNWHFGSTRKWYLNFGPNLGFLTAAKLESQNIKGALNSFELGIGVGIGYKVEVSDSFSLGFDFQENIGLTYVNKEGYYRANKFKNIWAGFNLKAIFKLGNKKTDKSN